MSHRTRRALGLGTVVSTLTLGLMTAAAAQPAHAAVQKQYDSWKASCR